MNYFGVTFSVVLVDLQMEADEAVVDVPSVSSVDAVVS